MGEIRVLTREDTGAVRALENAVFTDAYREDAVRDSILASYALCFGYFEGGVLSGYLLGTAVPPEAEILRVGVAPAERRRGVADALVSAFLSDAGKSGVTRVYLEVRTDNDPAVRLYRKNGFRDLSRRKNYYRDPVADALVMCRILGENENDNTGF